MSNSSLKINNLKDFCNYFKFLFSYYNNIENIIIENKENLLTLLFSISYNISMVNKNEYRILYNLIDNYKLEENDINTFYFIKILKLIGTKLNLYFEIDLTKNILFDNEEWNKIIEKFKEKIDIEESENSSEDDKFEIDVEIYENKKYYTIENYFEIIKKYDNLNIENEKIRFILNEIKKIIKDIEIKYKDIKIKPFKYTMEDFNNMEDLTELETENEKLKNIINLIKSV